MGSHDSIFHRIQHQEQRNKFRIAALDAAALTEGQSKARAGWASSESGLPGHNSTSPSHKPRYWVSRACRSNWPGGLGSGTTGTSRTCRVYQPLICSHPKPYGPTSHGRVPGTGLDERLPVRGALRPITAHHGPSHRVTGSLGSALGSLGVLDISSARRPVNHCGTTALVKLCTTRSCTRQSRQGCYGVKTLPHLTFRTVPYRIPGPNVPPVNCLNARAHERSNGSLRDPGPRSANGQPAETSENVTVAWQANHTAPKLPGCEIRPGRVKGC